jgi:hypothetical protein
MYNLLHQDNVINNDKINIISKTWKSTKEDFIERYNTIVDEMCETYKDLLNTSEYVANLKVPFCWEYVRNAFANELYELLEEFQHIDVQISSFNNEVDMHYNLSIQRADIKLSDSAIDYLDNVLGYYAHKSSCIKEDLSILKKHGQESFINSQQLYNTCGDERF